MELLTLLCQDVDLFRATDFLWLRHVVFTVELGISASVLYGQSDLESLNPFNPPLNLLACTRDDSRAFRRICMSGRTRTDIRIGYFSSGANPPLHVDFWPLLQPYLCPASRSIYP